MTEQIRQEANRLADEICKVEKSLAHCKIMMENHHNHLQVSSTMSFTVPNEIANGILQLSRDALERQLTELEHEFEQL